MLDIIKKIKVEELNKRVKGPR